ncbi:50S ribosomal protein L4 [Halobacterium salinarum]|uniref:Large ribosomal subunit protein uL4 n=5 Tax=Halobacterium salinarum TaxID=2242 RepID=RL4_HALSA|nr:50S ribosomal protein L4 [Halobacterium salinarum]B0R657.1 RecName: Full=Large ribosomal subunit protein uL4; AltName: Full=50S ribosomal protein L4 [Halobacterium salinarum R1]Q9HPD3.1 RecName: Full=Large ribosomal subunit protein uL4; AltName: Full=50S ribosomal protein L4 [Halobacterium salinarum NRC-1]AAG19937.1 50S ribosomal protein L4E [Halobacterium salinarum NRC-1]MBB6088943.1 large subunit ribosomal protein L4e [Halobacterium salinarum]MDL0118667.1 50S ribosomal protein L4 [Halobac
MQVTVRDLDGDDAGTLDLPRVFEEPVRPDLVKRAVLAAQANRTQEYGADEYAGLRTTAESQGSGRGMAHVPKANGQGARVPQTVGGRKAHPPKAEKDHGLDVNDKERKAAVRAAVAATTDSELVADRGHNFDDDVEFPLVVSDDFEDLVKTQDVVSLLEALGVHADIERADEGRTVRAGQGTLRGRKYQEPTSILFVTASESGPSTAARNLAGVDVATGREVNAEDLAPGAEPGRLTVWTESAVEEVAQR